jgi:glucose-1-phosphate cytidylyltransferase
MVFMLTLKEKFNNFTVVILAGGKGTRLSEETHRIPKPMVQIGKKPIISHIIQIYKNYGFNNFYLLGGYKFKIIKNFFNKKKEKNVHVVNTGMNTMTGGRVYKIVKKIKKKSQDEDFFLTYGDGVSDIDIAKLYKMHKKNRKIATMTVVRPPARWGYAILKNKFVKNFEEKNQLKEGWINGGFFIFNFKIIKYFKKFKNKNKIILEKDILPQLVKQNELVAYKHQGFWQCMDNVRDKYLLNKIWKINKKWKPLNGK